MIGEARYNVFYDFYDCYESMCQFVSPRGLVGLECLFISFIFSLLGHYTTIIGKNCMKASFLAEEQAILQ